MYSVCYSPDGTPNSIKRETDVISFIPLDEENRDFAAFIAWNSQQATPLDWETLISPMPDELYREFDKPIKTTALYADDVYVSSRDINPDADAAFLEAIQETEKEKGQAKSLDLIARSALKALEKARREIYELKATVKEIEKRLKKLEK